MRILIRVSVALLALLPVAGLSSDRAAGAGLFLRGEGATALLAGGQVRVDASGFACAQCHGADGLGRREGGTEFPPLAWSSLSDPGRTGGAYDAASLSRAIRQGIAADGRVLSDAMPRYEVDSQTLSSLGDFLAHLDERERRGVSASSIGIGFPPDRARRRPFDRALSEANAVGGAWGRRFTEATDGEGLVDWDEAEARLSADAGRVDETAAARPLSDVGSEHTYRVGEAIVEAVFACGRGVTRTCVRERLDEAGPVTDRASR